MASKLKLEQLAQAWSRLGQLAQAWGLLGQLLRHGAGWGCPPGPGAGCGEGHAGGSQPWAWARVPGPGSLVAMYFHKETYRLHIKTHIFTLI